MKLGNGAHDWPRGPFSWQEGRHLMISVPFTWNLPALRQELEHGSLLWDSVRVGGPAVSLLPDFLTGIPGVDVGGDVGGIANGSPSGDTLHNRLPLEVFFLWHWPRDD